MATVEERIVALLRQEGAPFEVLDHDPGASALELARLRGTDPRMGGKSIVMKLERTGVELFQVIVVPGDGRIDGKRFRKGLGVQRYRFATAGELHQRTGLTIGEVPPFGRPIFDLDLVVDSAVARSERIVFTIGRRDRSVTMATADWLAVAAPERVVPLTAGPED